MLSRLLRSTVLLLLAATPAALKRDRLTSTRSASELWDHMRNYVLQHRRHVGYSVRLQVWSAKVASPHDADKALRQEFAQQALPENMQLVDGSTSAPATHVYMGSSCGALESSKHLWDQLEPGSIVAAPVCSEAEFDEAAHSAVHVANCLAMWGNDKCGASPGKRFSCHDLPWKNLERVGFVQGFVILEKHDTDQKTMMMGSGLFLKHALEAEPPTDKVTKHQYQLLYERYFPSKQAPDANSFVEVGKQALHQQRESARDRMMARYLVKSQAGEGNFLEIGLGCNMQYGPGKSAVLWKKYFPKMHVAFLEYNGECVKRWSSKMQSLNISVYVGNQEEVSTNKYVASKAGDSGYEIVVDDGAHTNTAMRTSFKYLWPVVSEGGFYVIEDLGEPSFSYLDCEPITTINEKQTRTAMARVIEMAKPLVLGERQAKVARIECDLEICLLQKA